MDQHSLDELCRKLYAAKQAEDAARAERVAIEEAICALMPGGENSLVRGTGCGMKVSVKRALIYKADVSALASNGFIDLLDPIPASQELNEKRYEALRESDPKLFAKAAEFVITKPRKPSVKLDI